MVVKEEPKEISGAEAIASLFVEKEGGPEQSPNTQTIESIGQREQLLKGCCGGSACGEGHCCDGRIGSAVFSSEELTRKQ